MCGIVGIFNYGGNKSTEELTLHRMCDLLKHRGPDDDGYFVKDKIALGMRRLAIIDLATGRQPIHNEDESLWIVLNGEIYNFKDLRKELETQGHKFYTNTDTETIIHLYEEYGDGCVEKLRGMFAFALWDNKEEKLFIAKDRLGKKPLYYTVSDGNFVFSSEIPPLLEYLRRTPEILQEAIDLYLTYQYIPSPMTIFKDIKSLPPAHTLVCNRQGNIKIERYWSVNFLNKTNLSFQESCQKTADILSEATKLRLISDVPLGAFLSGGHDSSIIVGLMSRFSDKPVKTFSIGFEEEDFSELHYARIVAKHFGTEHNEFIVRPNFVELLPKIVWHYGQPFADSSALPSYIVSRETRKYVTVALNGDGGDETFGGYLRYKALAASPYLSWFFYAIGRENSERLASLVPFTKRIKFFRYLSRMISGLSLRPSEKNIFWHCIFPDDMRGYLYSSGMKSRLAASEPYDYLVKIFENAPSDNLLDRAFYTDIMSYLPECLLVKMDIASMANSLEARSPFLDHKVVEFSATLPSSWKIRGLTTKYILKKTFKGFLPSEIINRPKQGFGIPVGKWFRNDWKNYFREVVLSERALNRGYFRRESLERIFGEHISGYRDHGYRLWALLMLELWHRIYIDKEKF